MMSPILCKPLEIQTELRTAVIAEVSEHGLAEFQIETIISQFAHRIRPVTILRWTKEALESVARENAIKANDPINLQTLQPHRRWAANDDAAQAAASAPARREHKSILPLMDLCVQSALQTATDAEGDFGRPADAKRKIAANEHLRKCLDTAARQRSTLYNANRIDKLHQSIIKEIAKESPDCANRITLALMDFIDGRD